MYAATIRVLVSAVALIAIASVPLHAADPPAAPLNLQAQTTGGNVFLTWRAGGDTAPDWFRVEAGSAPGLADLAIINLPWGRHRSLEGHFAASGVAPAVYYVRVRALSGSAASNVSNEVVIHVGKSSCPIPAAPRNVVASVDSPIVTLAWDVTAADGVSASGYVIEAGSTPGAPNIAIIAIMEQTRLSVNAPPGRYFVRLRSMGQCGSSEPSPEVEVIVPPTQ
ncbi:MAG TPA: fibronectin type III domain-containing protein [Vicinamibacterales bacterium]|nr:fibronectin type III domain-containing protein [Vicinamibacterales bacterium]